MVAVAIPIAGGLGYFIWHQYQGLVQSSERVAGNLVSVTAAYDKALINDARDVLIALTNSPVLRHERWDECGGYLPLLLARMPRYANIGVISPAGRLVCSGLPDPDAAGSFLGDRAYFREAINQSDVALSGFLLGRIVGIPTLVLAARVTGDSGLPVGVAYVSLNLNFLRAGAAIPNLLPGSRLWILDQQGHVLQRIPSSTSHLGERLDPLPRGTNGLWRNRIRDNDGQYWQQFAMPAGPVDDPDGLSVRYDVPEPALLAEANQALRGGLLVVFLLVCIAGLVVRLLILRSRAEQDALRRGLLERERLLGQLMDTMTEAMCAIDAQGRCLFVNQACLDLLGYDRPSDLVGRQVHGIIHYQHEDGTPHPLEDCRIQRALIEGKGVHADDEVFWRRGGTCIPVEYWSYPIWRDGELEFCLVSFLDISERRAQQRALAYQASHDPLTGLLNRGEVRSRVAQRIRAAAQQPWILVISNLDGFKEVNDALGHDVGDRLLQEIAGRYRNVLGSDCVLGRVGGDEFSFILDTDDLRAAQERVRQLLAVIRDPLVLNDLRVQVSCSFGMAAYPEHARGIDDMARCADAAMRRAKRDGLGIAVFSEQDRTQMRDRLLLRGELRTALDQGQFALHLQPKIALTGGGSASGAPVGFEALVRWQHPQHGMISPGQFIPMIEVSDLIHPFTRWVVDQALACCKRLQDLHRGVGIAVNISARNLLDADFPQQIDEALQRHGLPAGLLELEVTESAIMSDPARAMNTLHALHALGVRLSIDDFGTGYSTFAYLHKLPVDAIKIDQSFVSPMATDSDMRAIVRSIIDMSHILNLQVIAEGVESREVRDLLREMGCDIGQGFEIGRPVPEAQARAWLKGSS